VFFILGRMKQNETKWFGFVRTEGGAPNASLCTMGGDDSDSDSDSSLIGTCVTTPSVPSPAARPPLRVTLRRSARAQAHFRR
jgi:hypothetical protein